MAPTDEYHTEGWQMDQMFRHPNVFSGLKSIISILIVISLVILPVPTTGQSVQGQASTKEIQDFTFAQGLFVDGLYDLAVEQFDRFILDHPQSQWRSEAAFKAAESRFLSHNFTDAISRFQVGRYTSLKK